MSSINEHPYLTRAKLADIVQKVEGVSEVELLECKTTDLSCQGKNYSGEIIFCDLTAKINNSTTKEYHWAVKLPKMDHKERLALHRQFMMEKKEMLFYNDMLPEWRRLIRDRGAKFDINCFDSPYSEIHDDVQKGSILVMENLTCHGFTDDAFDKTKGLDIHHAKVALEEMAKFHALGYAKLNSYPGSIKEGIKANPELCRDYLYVECANMDVQETFTASMVTGMQYQLEVAQEPGQDFVKAFHQKLEEEGGVLALRKGLYTPKKGEFNTLAHGDAHLMNIMFKYNKSGLPVAAAWVDVSATRFTNPAGDLVYFLYSSTTPQLRSTHLEKHLLGYYHDTLMTCLAQLGEDPSVYPFRQLMADFDRYAFLGLVDSMYIVPPFYVKKEDSIDQSDLDIDWNDKEQIKMATDRACAKLKKSYEKVPQVKSMIAGNFLDLVRRGHIKLDI